MCRVPPNSSCKVDGKDLEGYVRYIHITYITCHTFVEGFSLERSRKTSVDIFIVDFSWSDLVNESRSERIRVRATHRERARDREAGSVTSPGDIVTTGATQTLALDSTS